MKAFLSLISLSTVGLLVVWGAYEAVNAAEDGELDPYLLNDPLVLTLLATFVAALTISAYAHGTATGPIATTTKVCGVTMPSAQTCEKFFMVVSWAALISVLSYSLAAVLGADLGPADYEGLQSEKEKSTYGVLFGFGAGMALLQTMDVAKGAIQAVEGLREFRPAYSPVP